MSDVDFNEPQYAPTGGREGNRLTFFSRTIINLGLAKDDAGSQKVMGIIAFIAAALAVIVYLFLA